MGAGLGSNVGVMVASERVYLFAGAGAGIGLVIGAIIQSSRLTRVSCTPRPAIVHPLGSLHHTPGAFHVT